MSIKLKLTRHVCSRKLDEWDECIQCIAFHRVAEMHSVAAKILIAERENISILMLTFLFVDC